MAKRAIQKIDLVPDWVREALLEDGQTAASAFKEGSYKVPNIAGLSPKVRDAAMVLNQKDSGVATVELFYGTKGLEGWHKDASILQRNYTSAKEAEIAFNTLSAKLKNIQSMLNANESKALEMYQELLEGEGGGESHADPKEVGSRTMSTLAEGWTIVSSQNQLLVKFEGSFLNTLFSKFTHIGDTPVSPSEQVYSTSTRQHCGLDNFVISHWRKVNTAGGNIVRNAALISRAGGESYFLSGMSIEGYNKLCQDLTPNPTDYGISYDSVTGKWIKIAKVVMQNLFFDTVDEAIEWKNQTGAKGGEALPDLMPSKKEKKGKGDETETESLPLGDSEATAPIGEASGDAAPESRDSTEELMDLLKKEAKAE